jgi:alpha-galactosidase
MRRLILSLFLLGFFCSYSFSEDIFIPVETSTHAIVFQVTENNHVKIFYNGRKFKDEAEYVKTKFQYNLTSERALSNNNIFVAAGTDNNFIEPAIAVVHSDGNNSLDLVYEKHTVNLTTDDAYLTVITLKDAVYPFYVDLYYKAWKNVDVIEQWSVIRHKEKGIVLMNKYASANLYFFDKNYYLTSYNNNWAKEMQPEITPLKEGIHDIQSRLGTRANLFSSQNFMISFENQATEDNGKVLLGQLAWNGNFLIQFEIDEYKNLHLIAGIILINLLLI